MVKEQRSIWFEIAFGMLLALMLILHATLSHAEEFQWRHFGADPYASTQTEAMRTRESAFQKLGLPSEVVSLLMEATEKQGEKVRLVNGNKLDAMLSKGGLVHKDVTVAFVKPPESGKMEYTAPAQVWQVSWRRKTYTVYLPDICNNWSVVVARSSDACATVISTVVPGDIVRFVVLTQKRLPASACWQLCDGDACSALPSPCDTCDWIGPRSVLPAGFEPLHSGKYVAQSAKQSLRFPREVMSNYVALCVTRTGFGESDSWVVQPSAWVGVSTVSVPYGGQQWPAWGQVDMSKWAK